MLHLDPLDSLQQNLPYFFGFSQSRRQHNTGKVTDWLQILRKIEKRMAFIGLDFGEYVDFR